MVRTTQSKYIFFLTRTCDCEEPGKPIFKGPGKADLCSTCGDWLRRQLRVCTQCHEQFLYIYRHYNMNWDTCWDCIKDTEYPPMKNPEWFIIAPEDAAIHELYVPAFPPLPPG